MWIYSQSSGNLYNDTGKNVSTGYSGYAEGKNNPKLENVVSLGPIPKGLWVIGEVYDSKNAGPYALPLYPHLHNACGRTYFRIHGDSAAHPGEASHGCIILNRSVRQEIYSSMDRLIKVIE